MKILIVATICICIILILATVSFIIAQHRSIKMFNKHKAHIQKAISEIENDFKKKRVVM